MWERNATELWHVVKADPTTLQAQVLMIASTLFSSQWICADVLASLAHEPDLDLVATLVGCFACNAARQLQLRVSGLAHTNLGSYLRS